MKLFNFQKAKFPGYMKEKGNIELNQSDICSELFFHGDIADWTVSNKIQSVNCPFVLWQKCRGVWSALSLCTGAIMGWI